MADQLWLMTRIREEEEWRWAVENRCVFGARLKALSDRSGDRSAGVVDV